MTTYHLLSELGRGTMGVVFRAVQVGLNREVAVKLLSANQPADPETVRRFQKEARALAKLTHRNIVKVFDAGVLDGQLFIAMELVTGRNLSTWLEERRPIPVGTVISLISQAADALAHTHACGLTHRDIKPSNMMAGPDGHLTLMDFGLVKEVDGTLLTRADSVLGTLRYLAPESLQGSPSGHAADVYALAVSTLELLLGQAWSDINHPGDLMKEIDRAIPLHLTQKLSGVPPLLIALQMRALDVDPRRRPSAAAYRDELEQHGTDPTRTWGPTRTEPVSEGLNLDCAGVVCTCPSCRRFVEAFAESRALEPSAADAFLSVPVERAEGHSRRSTAARVGFGFLAVALLSGPWVLQRFRPADAANPVRVRTDSRSGATPPPGIPSGAPAALHLTERWRLFSGYTERLRSGEAAARLAVRELRSAALIDLGNSPDAWSGWLQIGAWLESDTPGNPPRPLHSSSGEMDELNAAACFNSIDAGHETVNDKTVSIAFSRVVMYPDDGRTWLYMALILDMDGRPKIAKRAYARALDLLNRHQMENAPWVMWHALFRAYLAVNHRGLERIWSDWDFPPNDLIWTWDKFMPKLWETDPVLAERLLGIWSRDRRFAQKAGVPLGDHYIWQARFRPSIQYPGESDRALATWQESLRLNPASLDLRERIANIYLTRGLPERARPLLEGLPDRNATISYLSYLEDGSDKAFLYLPRTPRDTGGIRVSSQILGLMELGLFSIAADRLKGFTSGDPYDKLRLELGLMSAPHRESWAVEEMHRLVLAEPNSRIWCEAAGDLSLDTAATEFTALVAEFSRRPPPGPSGSLAIFARSLWYMRRGESRQSLLDFEQWTKSVPDWISYPGTSWWDASIMEILSRPIWMKAMGNSVDGEILNRCIELGDQAFSRYPSDYWRYLRHGDLTRAAGIAVPMFENRPDEPIWGFSQIWCAIARSQFEVKRKWIARLRASWLTQGRGYWILTWLRSLERASAHAPQSPASPSPR